MDESAELLACIPRLRRYARALLGGRAEADDLVQDTLERGWTKLHLYRRGTDLRAWLFTVMHNVHANRRRGERPEVPLDDAPEAATDGGQERALALRDLDAALARLPVEQREVLLLVVLEDMSYDEAARTLGVPVGTVMSRLSRARERMRRLMQGEPVAGRLKVVK